eukprot:scaffold117706_cov69-Phaeocystis_antarctica.AAC.1
MKFMFYVRSARAPHPQPPVGPAPARCYLAPPPQCGRPPPPACRPVYLALHHIPSFRLSAESVGVQPAAELRHLQRHGHERHVPGALLPVPCPQSAVKPCPTRRGRSRSPATSLSTRVGVQRAAELRHLQRHNHVPDVSGALLPLTLPQNCRAHAGYTAIARRLPPADPYTSLRTVRPFFRRSAVRVGVQSAAELRHVQGHNLAPDVRCTLDACPHTAFSWSPSATCATSTPCPPSDSVEREGLQPAADLRHVQCHGHGQHVQRALRACPDPASSRALP